MRGARLSMSTCRMLSSGEAPGGVVDGDAVDERGGKRK
jgi:hypothetical protein